MRPFPAFFQLTDDVKKEKEKEPEKAEKQETTVLRKKSLFSPDSGVGNL